MTATHVHEHDEMIRLADAILASASRNGAVQGSTLAGLRLAFARLVNKHCTDEGEMIRSAVARGLLSRTVVAVFERDLLRWRTELAMCNSEWPLARVLGDPRGFRHRFEPIVHALRDYIAREDREILAVIDGRSSAGRPAMASGRA